MRSKSSARTSLLAATSCAAYKIPNVRTICAKKSTGYVLKRRHRCLRRWHWQAKIPENRYVRGSFKAYIGSASRLTRPTPPETAAENAHRTFTVGPNHFVNLSSALRDLSDSLTWSSRTATMALVELHDCNWKARGCVRRSFFVCFS